MQIITELLIIIITGAFLVDIITQVAKNIGLVNYNTFVLIVSEIISYIGYFAYMSFKNFTHEWYYFILVAIIGIMIAFVSMFGYDKFKQTINQWKDKISDLKEE